jgi:hypothetical protein
VLSTIVKQLHINCNIDHCCTWHLCCITYGIIIVEMSFFSLANIMCLHTVLGSDLNDSNVVGSTKYSSFCGVLSIQRTRCRVYYEPIYPLHSCFVQSASQNADCIVHVQLNLSLIFVTCCIIIIIVEILLPLMTGNCLLLNVSYTF